MMDRERFSGQETWTLTGPAAVLNSSFDITDGETIDPVR